MVNQLTFLALWNSFASICGIIPIAKIRIYFFDTPH